MSGSFFHDASVLGIEFEDQTGQLFLNLRIYNNEIKRVRFDEVHDFNLDSFGSQNVLFDITHYGESASPLDEVLQAFPGLTEGVIEFAKNHNLRVYILEPSVGMSGYVVAARLAVI